jgi:PAS domain S-box-containing protein
MSLRKRTLVLISTTIALLGAAVFVISSGVLMRSFTGLENETARMNVGRVRDALAAEMKGLKNSTADWGNWDDAYRFAQDHNREFIDVNMTPTALASLNVNLIAFFDTSGRTIEARAFNLVSSRQQPLPSAVESLPRFYPRLLSPDMTAGATGVVVLDGRPMIVAARPVLTSDEAGPAHGTLLMGRWLDSAEIDRLASTTHLSVATWPAGDPDLPGTVRSARTGLDDEQRAVVRPLSPSLVAGYTMIEDLNRTPVVALEVTMPRSIYRRGRSVVRVMNVAMLIACLVLGGLALVLVEKSVLGRLARLTRDVVELGRSRDVRLRVAEDGQDELATLGCEINRSVSELAEAQQAVRESEERFRDLFDGTSDLIQSVTPDGRYAYVNQAWLDALCYDAGDVPRLSIHDVIHPDSRAHCMKQFERIMTGEKLKSVEAAFVGKDGRRIEVEGNISARLVNGRPVHTRGIFRDVTQRNRFVAELKTANVELARAYQDLAVSQRQELLDMAMQHDFGTPMAVLQGYADMLRDGLLGQMTDRQRKAVEKITGSLQAMNKLRREMLEVTGFDRQNIPLERTEVNLAELVRSCAGELSPLTQDRHIQVRADLPEDRVRCDPGRVRQVVSTYLASIVKYAPDGCSIDVKGERENGNVHVVFDTTCKAAGGLGAHDQATWGGLGMALAQAIIQAHGGRAWSEDDASGYQLHFTLPSAN